MYNYGIDEDQIVQKHIIQTAHTNLNHLRDVQCLITKIIGKSLTCLKEGKRPNVRENILTNNWWRAHEDQIVEKKIIKTALPNFDADQSKFIDIIKYRWWIKT